MRLPVYDGPPPAGWDGAASPASLLVVVPALRIVGVEIDWRAVRGRGGKAKE